jgi:3'-5' exoribonuclease
LKSHFVRDLQAEQVVTSSFIVQSKEVRQKKSGEPYLSLLLADRTGVLDAKMWDGVAEICDTFGRDDFVKVKGLIQEFHNKPQMTVHKLQRLEDGEIDPADYFPHTEKNVEEMWGELRRTAASLANPHLRALLEAILGDEEIAERYRTAPAAKTIHHARLGGLLEHVISLLGLCRRVAEHYPLIDTDLLLTGAVLHDIGKIYELDYRRSFGYSTAGQLLGHLIIGLQMVDGKIAGIAGFPPKLKMLVEHLILSHHGQYEFGSPKLPSFPEALLLHHLDNLDSKIESMRMTVENDRNIAGEWTNYNPALERPVLKMDRFLAETPAETPGAPETKPAAAEPKPARAKMERGPTLFGEALQSALTKDGDPQ